MSRYAYVGAGTGELLSYLGKVLVHDNRTEMEFFIPKARVVRITDGDFGQPVMELKDHPSLTKVRWPLQREDFP